MSKYFLLLCLLIIRLEVFSQDSVSKEVIIEKLRDIRDNVNKVENKSKVVQAQRKECRTLINDALVRLDAFTGDYPEAYDKSIDRLVRFSRELPNAPESSHEEMLTHLSRDIRIKFQERPNQLGGKLYNGLIKVSITSLKNGTTIHYLRVRYAALGYKIDHTRPESNFQQLTSPAIENIVPGFYEIWVTQDGDFKVLQRWVGEISPEKNNEIVINIF